MRLGTLAYDGDTFLVHIHVIPSDSDAIAELRAFRDRLRGDPVLMQAYMARKRAIIAAEITGFDYTVTKGSFIQAVLASDAEG